MSQFSSGILPTNSRLGVNAGQRQPPLTQNPLSPFELGPSSSSFEFQSSPAQSPGTLPSQGSSGLGSGQIPFFFSPNNENASGLRLPQPPGHTEPFGRTQGFRTDREVVGTSLTGLPIFSFEQGARDKILSADLEFGSPNFNQDFAKLLNSFDPGGQTEAAQGILQQAFGDFEASQTPEVGGGDSFTQGAAAAGAGGGTFFGGAGIPQESALNESLVGLIGSLIQSLLTSGQFAAGGGVAAPAPQQLFRTDLDRLGVNRF